MDESWHMAYDVAKQGYDGQLFVLLALILAGLITIGFVLYLNRHRASVRASIILVGLIFGSIIGLLGVSNVFYQRWRCINWIQTNRYSVIEGEVKNFVPMPYDGHANESFVVNGVRFEYSDYNLSSGGFNNTASHGGPIKAGLWVRIAYNHDVILRLEIRKEVAPRGDKTRTSTRLIPTIHS